MDEITREAGSKTTDENDHYIKVINLLTHVDNLDAEDLFQYVVTAALLTTYLEKRTNFFDCHATSKSNRLV